MRSKQKMGPGGGGQQSGNFYDNLINNYTTVPFLFLTFVKKTLSSHRVTNK